MIVFSPKRIARNFMPAYTVEDYAKGDLRAKLVSRLNQGRSNEIIQEYDQGPNVFPKDDRVLNSLAWANLMEGNIERARALTEYAISRFGITKQARHQAMAMNNRAAVAFRLEGFPAANALLRNACAVDPECMSAWSNTMNYASKLQHLAALESSVSQFLSSMVNWHHDARYIYWLRNESDLAWARSQKCFAPLMARLNR